MLNTRLRISLVMIGWLCMSAVAYAKAIPFVAPQDRPQLAASQPWPKNHFLVLGYHDVEDDIADQRYLSVRTSALNEQIAGCCTTDITRSAYRTLLMRINRARRCRRRLFC